VSTDLEIRGYELNPVFPHSSSDVVGRFMSPSTKIESSRQDVLTEQSKLSKSAQDLKALLADTIKSSQEAEAAAASRQNELARKPVERKVYCTSISR
jgi:hypothetical protein